MTLNIDLIQAFTIIQSPTSRKVSALIGEPGANPFSTTSTSTVLVSVLTPTLPALLRAALTLWLRAPTLSCCGLGGGVFACGVHCAERALQMEGTLEKEEIEAVLGPSSTALLTVLQHNAESGKAQANPNII